MGYSSTLILKTHENDNENMFLFPLRLLNEEYFCSNLPKICKNLENQLSLQEKFLEINVEKKQSSKHQHEPLGGDITWGPRDGKEETDRELLTSPCNASNKRKINQYKILTMNQQ